ncbi:MAG: ATP phosphoribosyltransferase regulatory subunit [Actinobacteria bacterium]|nr:ATP phosphoribosyltransferase regulatory subunit [Actinomycetota bacterium]
MNGPKPNAPAFAAGSVALATPVPTGSRDVLPEEMAELREIERGVLEAFLSAGYGEVATPAFEYDETMRLAGPETARNAYRVTDKNGEVLVARFDCTIPIARLAASRFRSAEPPLRFCYLQSVLRPVEPKRGQSREYVQIGMELMGLPAPEGDAEAIVLLVKVLKAAGLTDFKIAVGDARFFTDSLDSANASLTPERRTAILYELQTRDLVGLRRELAATGGFDDAQRDELVGLAAARGGREVLDRHAADRLRQLDDLLRDAGVDDRVIYDLGLVRSLDYYTGAVLEVFVPSDGFALGGGGRYDELAGKFGRDLAACGFALNMERLHLAVLAEREAAK